MYRVCPSTVIRCLPPRRRPPRPSLATSRKQRPSFELLCELVFRPLAHLVVVALLPLRVPPPAVVGAATVDRPRRGGRARRAGHLVVAAILLQVKTVLDNADGQLARASGRVSVLGRYLDSESDLLVDAALFVGARLSDAAARARRGSRSSCSRSCSAPTSTWSCSTGASAARRARRARATGCGRGARAHLRRRLRAAGPADRAGSSRRRLRGRSAEARLAYHDRGTLLVLANFGLSTQLAVLGLCLALGHPAAYLWVVLACGAVARPAGAAARAAGEPATYDAVNGK